MAILGPYIRTTDNWPNIGQFWCAYVILFYLHKNLGRKDFITSFYEDRLVDLPKLIWIVKVELEFKPGYI